MDDAAPPPVAPEVLDDLRQRLRAHRPVAGTGTAGWDRGTEAGYLAELVRWWAEEYDWRPHEERIRALPWERAGALRVVHQRAADPGAPVVVLLHGWPDSVLRYERVLPQLTDVHVVVPALPGYPFAAPVDDPDLSSALMSDLVADALTALGYDRAVVSAGDIGRGVAVGLASRHRDRLAALHLTDVPTNVVTDGGPTAEERELQQQVLRWRLADGAYALEQATRPHTLAAALGDSPAGLAAWIVEKLRDWSDSGGDVEQVWSRADLLTWITAYWVTGAIGTSFAPYAHRSPDVGRMDVPTVVQQFPGELIRVARPVAERAFDLRGWREEDSGGHFAAWERPQVWLAGLREALGVSRAAG
ncbi:epoxide hydrolase [Modestobacter sp. NPDC049651]|uniref:epoxide hydrolase family protein n=1 Tax=unclassified Modestobacter TaxID=2643866 RepID=UPI0034058F12